MTSHRGKVSHSSRRRRRAGAEDSRSAHFTRQSACMRWTNVLCVSAQSVIFSADDIHHARLRSWCLSGAERVPAEPAGRFSFPRSENVGCRPLRDLSARPATSILFCRHEQCMSRESGSNQSKPPPCYRADDEEEDRQRCSSRGCQGAVLRQRRRPAVRFRSSQGGRKRPDRCSRCCPCDRAPASSRWDARGSKASSRDRAPISHILARIRTHALVSDACSPQVLPIPPFDTGLRMTNMSYLLSSAEASIDSLGQHATIFYTTLALSAGIWTMVDMTRKLRSNTSPGAQVWPTSVSCPSGAASTYLTQPSPGHYRAPLLLYPGSACRLKCGCIHLSDTSTVLTLQCFYSSRLGGRLMALP